MIGKLFSVIGYKGGMTSLFLFYRLRRTKDCRLYLLITLVVSLAKQNGSHYQHGAFDLMPHGLYGLAVYHILQALMSVRSDHE